MKAKATLLFMLLQITGFAPAYGNTPVAVDVGKLEESWENVKTEYRNKFKEALSLTDQKIRDLERQRDFGDAARRDQISEELNDARRLRERLERRADEIHAAGMIDFANIKNRVKDVVEDVKD